VAETTLVAAEAAAAALGISAEEAGALAHAGEIAATAAASALRDAIGQPIRIGAAQIRPAAPGEPENENLDLFHPVDMVWDVSGSVYSTLLLLPKAELQTVLPTARGSADLPDMEALGTLLRSVAEQVGAQLGRSVPIQFSLSGEGAGHGSGHDQPQLRIEHPVSVGQDGAEIVLTVVHLVPEAALRSIAALAPAAPAASDGGSDDEDSRESSTHPAAGASASGGESRTMEDLMAAGQASQTTGTSVHPVQFQPFDTDGTAQGGTNLDLLLDVSLRVSVELGRTDLAIKDVLALGPGSVVELDKLAGEPVDILVNDRLIAKGEVVVVDENFGVRVTDIVSPQKRIGKLR
jgi:flagellar motor switch protein FliN